MMSIDELINLMKSGKNYILVDVRSRDMYDEKHIPGALSVPVEEIGQYASRLNKDQMIVTYCGGFQCPASTLGSKEFMKLGFKDVWDYKGGIEEWEKKGLTVERA